MSAQAGILYRDSRPVTPEAIAKLSRDNQAHGPDYTGVHTDQGLAMLSFALHFDKLATRERQPVLTSDSSVLTWDGRLDNREDFIVRLERETRGDYTDASLVGQALAKWQTDALVEIVGEWSLAWWDGREKQLLLARDVSGARDLYYCATPDYVAWSTTIRPLVDLCERAGAINEDYIIKTLTQQNTGQTTHYRDILRVPAGHLVAIRAGAPPTIRGFHRFTVTTLRYRDVRQYQEHYRTLLTEAVKVRLRSSTPVWSELSGGYDSSSTTCVATRLIRAGSVEAPSLKPISFVDPASPESDESRYIEAVEDFCDLRSLRITFPQYIALRPDFYARPYSLAATPPSVPQELLQPGCHVLLSGHFGDSVTKSSGLQDILLDHLRAGEVRSAFHDLLQHCRFERQWLPAVLWDLVASLRLTHSKRVERARRRARTTKPAGRATVPIDPAANLGLRSDFYQRAVSTGVSTPQLVDNLPRGESELLVQLHTFVDDVGHTTETSLPRLRRAYPFMHRPLLDFALALPSSLSWCAGDERAFVCSALREVLPPLVLVRRSKGEGPPMHSRALMPVAMDYLGTFDSWLLVKRGYADASALDGLIRAFIDGSRPTAFGTISRLISTERLLNHALHSDVVSPV
jgi:hypothetical protein